MVNSDGLSLQLPLVVYCPVCHKESTYAQSKETIQEVKCMWCGQQLKVKVLTQYICEVTKVVSPQTTLDTSDS